MGMISNEVIDNMKQFEGVRNTGRSRHCLRGLRIWETRVVPIPRVLINTYNLLSEFNPVYCFYDW